MSSNIVKIIKLFSLRDEYYEDFDLETEFYDFIRDCMVALRQGHCSNFVLEFEKQFNPELNTINNITNYLKTVFPHELLQKNREFNNSQKNTTNLYKLAKGGFFREIVEEGNELEFGKAIDKQISLLKQHNEIWDYKVVPVFECNSYDWTIKLLHYELLLVIEYPEIQIKANKNKFDKKIYTRDLKGVITATKIEKLLIDKDDCYYLTLSSNLEITRANLSYTEYKMSYIHSHAQKLSINDPHKVLQLQFFCMGSNYLQTIIESNRIDNNYGEHFFELFLLSLRGIIEEESSLGSAYISIFTLNVEKVIFTQVNNHQQLSLMDNFYDRYIEHILKPNKFDLKVVLQDDKLKVCNDDRLYNSVELFIEEGYNDNNLDKFNFMVVNKSGVYQRAKKNGIETEEDLIEINNELKSSYYINGQEKHFIIEPEEINISNEIDIIEEIYPPLLNLISEQLSKKISENERKRDAIIRECTKNKV